MLRSTTQEPADGLRQYQEWRAARAERLQEGARPQFRVRSVTEIDTLPEGVEAEVEIIPISEMRETARVKRGRKYGDLVHALLARAEYPADRARLAARAAAYEVGSALSEGDRQAAVDTVVRCLSHPLMSEARRAERVHREYPVTCEVGGQLYEGVIDVAWFDGARWTVVDYKTGAGDELRYRRQIAMYGEALRKATGAPVRLIVLELV